ncbi:MAG: hypothetical protein OHK0021_09190 [Bryobacter sp.]
MDRENFWLAWGRAGLRTVAHNTTQGFPCTANNSGPGTSLLNGYQTDQVAPEKILNGADVEWLTAAPAGFSALPRSRRPHRIFRYKAGQTSLTGVVYARTKSYDTLRLGVGSGATVDVAVWSAEDEPLDASTRPRALARYFSPALTLDGDAGVFFRLFEISKNGKQFLLYQTPAKRISLCDNGPGQAVAAKQRIYNAAGPFVGNGAGGLYARGAFGPTLKDGIAERRFLETLELHARQTQRYSEALLNEFSPRLFVDYLSAADDMLHLWWSLSAKGESFLDPFRAWGYQILDWRVAQLAKLGAPEDHLVVVSDHGMTAMDHELRLNLLLRQWGYRDRVFATYYGLFVNTSDWLGGLVKPEEKRTLLEEVKAKLAGYRFADKPLFRAFYWPEEIQAEYGVGGDRGADLYFELAPGWSLSMAMEEPVAKELAQPRGEHGPLPTREDLLAIFLHLGPEIHSRPARLRTRNVAGYVKRLLGLP